MNDNRRLRIIKQVLNEIKATGKPIGWRTIKKKYGVTDSQAKRLAQSICDILKIDDNTTVQIKIEVPKLKYKRDSKKTCFILLSDWHIGEIVSFEETELNEYNLEIAHTRILLLLEKISEILIKEKPTEVNLLFLGDLISGIIHDELEDQTNMIDQLSVATYFASLLIKAINPTNIYGIYGNHGRVNKNKKSKNIRNNFELILFKMVSLITGKEIKTSKSPYLLFKTLNETCFMTHGDFITSYGQLPAYGILRKQMFVNKYSRMLNMDHPRFVFLGHFHEPQSLSQFGDHVIVNGSLIGVNEYCLKRGLLGIPSQKIVIADKNSVTETNIIVDTKVKTPLPDGVDKITKWY